MTQEKTPIIQVNDLFQAGIVVRDLQKSIQNYQDLLGIGPWQTFNAGEMLSSLTYKGKLVDKPSFLVGLAMAGNMQIELIQPVHGELPYFDFLNEKGEGLHHMGHLRVPDIDAAVKDLEGQGFPCIFYGSSARTKFAYVDMTSSIGVVVELVETPPQK